MCVFVSVQCHRMAFVCVCVNTGRVSPANSAQAQSTHISSSMCGGGLCCMCLRFESVEHRGARVLCLRTLLLLPPNIIHSDKMWDTIRERTRRVQVYNILCYYTIYDHHRSRTKNTYDDDDDTLSRHSPRRMQHTIAGHANERVVCMCVVSVFGFFDALSTFTWAAKANAFDANVRILTGMMWCRENVWICTHMYNNTLQLLQMLKPRNTRPAANVVSCGLMCFLHGGILPVPSTRKKSQLSSRL